ncbi:MAG TPA: recombinase family protein [Acidimicrobiales bacterium]|nr:recombinase family protein [Acidimicrobiales bacterium]
MGGSQRATASRKRSATIAVGYVRVSTDEQVLGPEAQRVALTRWAEGRGLHLVVVHEDRGISGAAALDRRPGLLAAIDSLELHNAGYLVAAKRDRFARDVIIAAQLERLVLRQGSQLVSADGAGEGDSPEAELMRRMLDIIASYERSLFRGRTRAALATKRAKGLKFGSTAPYGWRLDGERLERDPDEQRMIVRLHELAVDGRSLRQLAVALTTEGFTPRGRRWHPNSVRRILRATPTGP